MKLLLFSYEYYYLAWLDEKARLIHCEEKNIETTNSSWLVFLASSAQSSEPFSFFEPNYRTSRPPKTPSNSFRAFSEPLAPQSSSLWAITLLKCFESFMFFNCICPLNLSSQTFDTLGPLSTPSPPSQLIPLSHTILLSPYEIFEFFKFYEFLELLDFIDSFDSPESFESFQNIILCVFDLSESFTLYFVPLNSPNILRSLSWMGPPKLRLVRITLLENYANWELFLRTTLIENSCWELR